jgi:hypothetical protein
MEKKLFLCLIIDKNSGRELASYEIESRDLYYARHSAANIYRFELNNKYNLPGHIIKKYNDNWYVDSMEME